MKQYYLTYTLRGATISRSMANGYTLALFLTTLLSAMTEAEQATIRITRAGEDVTKSLVGVAELIREGKRE